MYQHPFFQCRFCWEEISYVLDPSITRHDLCGICEVLPGNPINRDSLFFNDGELVVLKQWIIGQIRLS